MKDAQFERYLRALRMSYPDRAEFAVAVAREGYACGAEQMREKSAQFLEARAKQVGPNFGMDDAIRVLAYAIRKLPVGESSRAPQEKS